jgi:hypothetical protein
VERESKTTTWSKMKDYHMQRFLAGERFFVGRNVTNFDAMKLVFHDDTKGLNANITNYAKEVHPYLVHGKGSQLIVVITNHGDSDHQTSQCTTNNVSLCDTIIPITTRLNFTNAMELSQFGSTIAFSKFNNPTQVEPS